MRERNVRREVSVLATLLIATFVIYEWPFRVPEWAQRWVHPARTDSSTAKVADTVRAARPARPQPDTVPELPPVPASQIQAHGVLIPFRDDTSLTTFVTLYTDAEPVELDALGFLRVAALMDSTTRIELIGANYSIVSPVPSAAMDSAFQKYFAAEMCGDPPHNIRIRASSGAHIDSLWSVGLRAGVLEVLPRSAWLVDSDTTAANNRARRVIAALIPPDTTSASSGSTPSNVLFEKIPYDVSSSRRLAFANTEILIISADRQVARTVGSGDQAYTEHPGQVVFLIAERPLGSDAPYTAGYSFYRSEDAENFVQRSFIAGARLKQSGQPVLIIGDDLDVLAGGSFFVRSADGKWKEVAGWTTNCD